VNRFACITDAPYVFEQITLLRRLHLTASRIRAPRGTSRYNRFRLRRILANNARELGSNPGRMQYIQAIGNGLAEWVTCLFSSGRA